MLESGEELDSGAIKDKASKINYLDKIVALVGICSGHDIDVRPSKVVAGLEPEGTNALLTVRTEWRAEGAEGDDPGPVMLNGSTDSSAAKNSLIQTYGQGDLTERVSAGKAEKKPRQSNKVDVEAWWSSGDRRGLAIRDRLVKARPSERERNMIKHLSTLTGTHHA